MKIERKPDIVLFVPRQGATPLPPTLLEATRAVARVKGALLETRPAASGKERETESASEWNSLLLTARAQRGPQWDVATQQFLVDRDSHLYYNHTPLVPAEQSQSDQDGLGDAGPSDTVHQTPSGGSFRELPIPQYFTNNHTSYNSPVSSRAESLAPPSEGRRRITRANGGGNPLYQGLPM
ncbi:hypothetical protein BOTBODRAFT_184331 [Botryobasidium botryosum FD-172 SS1]|uniref:Uncharacterized protein n=1 Tax=Botryobasidium botryosum (strain FD-172 SS1) TaxID=930990 RepID=A0A067MU51_BOTB1|nr:hypothetical protein BOTBODRAFT_184331 [Botryobasidium botryosum FD-172 SS1]